MTSEPTPKAYEIEDCIRDAVRKIDDFIFSSTGERASQTRIAEALTKYFVLNEILEFIKMDRG